VWVAGGVFSVLLIAILNLSGKRDSVTLGNDPAAAAELRLLRDRVAQLEARLEQRSPGMQVLTRSPAKGFAPQQVSTATASAASMPAVVVEAPRPAPVVPGAPLRERTRPAVGKGTVPWASWWSDKDVQTANGEWCRKPPPYAAAKPALPNVPPGTDSPGLTTELAKKHASSDNMLIATYVNYNRLDFAYTFVKHLIALGNPHYLVGALDEKALRGLQSHGIQSFLINSGLTTNDYGWGTYAFRQLGLHKVQLVYNLAKTGVKCATRCPPQPPAWRMRRAPKPIPEPLTPPL
jgi:hypothetical protein